MELPLQGLTEILEKAGVVRLLAKPLAQNDNSKQQIYLGGSFDVLNVLPFGHVSPDDRAKVPTFKAPVDFHWLTETGEFQKAPGAQVILYPQYPEVRLSGFLKGCAAAPSQYMRPVPGELRGEKNAWDGRVLFLGVTSDNRVLAFLSLPGSAASQDFDALRKGGTLGTAGMLYVLPPPGPLAGSPEQLRAALLAALASVARLGWTPSVRMYGDGTTRPYAATNGGGYTLEALLGIQPNGRSEPDYLGWEVKAIGSDRVTLMTPEPDGGFYGEKGVQAFLRKYGRARGDDIYFTGTHRVGVPGTSGHTLQLAGFDSGKQKIEDVNGGILLTLDGNVTASWSFAALLEHWGRKHAQAVYVKYGAQPGTAPQYSFAGPAMLGTGTDFGMFLSALASGLVVYDPAPKIKSANGPRPTTKARSQFRIRVNSLAGLYHAFDTVALLTPTPI
ncbi:MvaI/BcnI family restriction endonuclease [Variovorax sp. J22R133]|uniref:MvaI/BcnI family restriction endonuclease n=1 Tax=Variovorax brevis TaxID=3053503 RepID=UPI0025760889|nr:MvaI/BcnI family restriction endonuclease [Variovorax sp. J22R133]MDM0114923.1 MvaI/BcnI family restriction endonuclease [Variovorax sp. J22R133]